MPEMVDTARLDPEKVLEALVLQAQVVVAAYKLSKLFPDDWGLIRPLETGEAQLLLNGNRSFGVLGGRHLELELSDEESFDPTRYDAANGQGEAAKAINSLRNSRVLSEASAQIRYQIDRRPLPPRHCIDTLIEVHLGLDVPASSGRYLDTFTLWKHYSHLKSWWDEPNSMLENETPGNFQVWDQKQREAGRSNSPTRTASEQKILLALTHSVLG